MGVIITISRGCFERCCSYKKTPPYHYNLSFVTLRTRRPTLLRAPAYRTPSEASTRRRCGHAGRFLWLGESGYALGKAAEAKVLVERILKVYLRLYNRKHKKSVDPQIYTYIYIYVVDLGRESTRVNPCACGQGTICRLSSRSTIVQILALTLLHIHTLPGGPLPLLCSRGGGLTPPPSHTLTQDALVRALCPVALRAGLLRAAWRTALCAWRWRKAGSFLPHSSFVFSKRKLQKLCVGRWGPVSL